MVWYFFFFQAEDGIRDADVTGVQTCALPICPGYETSRPALNNPKKLCGNCCASWSAVVGCIRWCVTFSITASRSRVWQSLWVNWGRSEERRVGKGGGARGWRRQCREDGLVFFFFSSRRRHTRCGRDWSSDVCSSDLPWVRDLAARFEQPEEVVRQLLRKLVRSGRLYQVVRDLFYHRKQITRLAELVGELGEIGRASCRERGWS